MTSPACPTASLPRRLAALVYDSLLLMALAMAYAAALLAIKHALLDLELGPSGRAELGSAGFVGLVLVLEAFYWFFWMRGGQTLGMRAWRLQLVNLEGGRVSLLQALVRGLVAPFSLLLLGLGFWWSLWDKERASWHDRASQTRVVLLPKDT